MSSAPVNPERTLVAEIDPGWQWLPETFEWNIRSDRSLFAWHALITTAYLLVPVGVFSLLWLLGSALPRVAWWLAVVTAVLAIFAALASGLFAWAVRGLAQVFFRKTGFLACLVGLGTLFFALQSPVSLFTPGFEAGVAPLDEWLLFLGDNLLGLVFFDILNLFELHLSAIRPVSWFSATLTLILKLLMGASLIQLVFLLIRFRHRETLFGTYRNLHLYCRGLPAARGLSVERVNMLHTLSGESVPVEEFQQQFRKRAESQDQQPAKLPPADADVVHKFDWDDPTTYQWEVSTTDAQKADKEFLSALAMGPALPVLLCLILWLIALLSDSVAFWLAIGLGAICVIDVIQNLRVLFTGASANKLKAHSKLTADASLLLGCLLYLLSSPMSNLAHGFDGAATASVGQWLLYYLDNLASVILLDIFDVYGIHLSAIRVQSWDSRALTLLVRLLIIFGVLSMIVAKLRAIQHKRTLYGTVQECYWNCVDVPAVKVFRLARIGQLSALDPIVIAGTAPSIQAAFAG